MSNHTISNNVKEAVRVGRHTTWQTAVPLPLYVYSWFRQRYQCECGQKFKTEKDYENHYRKAISEVEESTS